MSEKTQNPFEQAAAFQKIWSETFGKMAQAAFAFSPDSAPPEMMRQLRSSIFEAMAKSWEEFMRSPQFLEGAKKMMDNAIAFRKLTNDFLTRAHREMQSTARSDIDTVLLAMRHLEARVVDRVDDLAEELSEIRERLDRVQKGNRARAAKRNEQPSRESSKKKNAKRAKK
jgi:hypothetical protein